jgi:hypothetical protein
MNASANTVGAAQTWCSRTKSTTVWTYCSNMSGEVLENIQISPLALLRASDQMSRSRRHHGIVERN